jgi:Uma2 family endonuclease
MAFLEARVEDVIFPKIDLYSDEPPLETYLHLQQMMLLIKCLDWLWRDRQDFFAAGNLTIYYSPHQKKSEKFRGPDFFVVLGTERKPRKSWVVWEEEGKYPNIIIEILSPKTAKSDRGLKKQIYQDTFRTADYFWFDPDTLEFQGFQLIQGQYQELQPNQEGRLWSQQLGLYLGIHNSQLRFFTNLGELVLTTEEVATQSQSELEIERERVALLEQRLRDMGVEP